MIGPELGRYRHKVPSLIADAQAAEQGGFASIWVPQIPGDFDAFTMITLLGRATSRVELGTAVLPIQTRHPIAMAQEAASNQAVCEGRFALGIGVSHHWVVDGQLGLPYEATPDATVLLDREIGPEIRVRFCRGGRLDRSFLEQPALALPMLRDAFEGLRRQPAAAIAVPGRLEDTDGDGLLSVGELVRGLAGHLAQELATLARELERDGYPSYASWQEASAGTRGLALALFELTRPTFVERALYLDLVSRPFFGLLPPPVEERD